MLPKILLITILTPVTIILLFSSCHTAIQPEQRIDSAEENNVLPDPLRFKEEIIKIQQLNFDSTRDRIVFTGSSSIRMWKDIQDYYPDHQVINTGFGGSEMSDLHHYLEATVLRFAPEKIFIYEGDNDVNSKRPIELIVAQTEKVVRAIQQKFPDCRIYLISAKPSLARWQLKEKYIELNNAFASFAQLHSNCTYINIWEKMLDEQGEVLTTIFIDDGLHMNKQGYDLWDAVLRPYVEN